MRNGLHSSLKFAARALICGLALSASAAFADTVTLFDVSGNTFGSSGSFPVGCPCSFSGSLTVDVTTGAATGVHINFSGNPPGVPPFESLTGSNPNGPDWEVDSITGNSLGETGMALVFSTTPTPASLVGFAGGDIVGGAFFYVEAPMEIATISSGMITPAVVPEPSTWVMILLGFTGLGYAGYRRAKAGRATLAA